MIDIWHTVTSFGAWAGIGAIGVVLLLVFAPSVASVLAEYLKALAPLAKGAAEGVVWLLKTLWEGFTDMADNAASIIFVLAAILLSGWYFHSTKECPPVKCPTSVSKPAPKTLMQKLFTSPKQAAKPVPASKPSAKSKSSTSPGQYMAR